MRATRLTLLLCAVLVGGCASEPTAPAADGAPSGDASDGNAAVVPLTDAGVFAQATAAAGWTWYKLSTDTLAPASDSPHAARLRTRYNTVAATRLDTSGKVAPATLFPDGSLIVKEVYGEDGALALVVVMIKAAGDPNAGHGDWLWAEYGAGGNVLHSIAQSNATCHSCHVPGVDHTRMNDAHP